MTQNSEPVSVSTSAPSSDAPVVAVYRQELFKVTEPFVAAPALRLRRYRPTFVGERTVGTPPPGADVRLVSLASTVKRLRHNWLRAPQATLDALRGLKPRLVHAHFAIDATYALPVARSLHCPLVTTLHGYDVTRSRSAFLRSGNPKWITYARTRGDLFRRGDLFLAASDYLRERAVGQGVPKEKIRTHYTGVDTSALRPTPVPETSALIVHVARLTEKKGTRYLVEAFASIAKDVADARLAIIGDGPLRPSLERQTRRLGLSERVQFLGTLPDYADVLDWTRRARVACLPSVTASDGDAEGFGMTLIEAAALGRPVVATRHGPFPEVVEDGRTGFLVPERDVAALAERLTRVLADHGTAKKLGEAGRRRVEERFDLAAQAASLEKHYDALVAP